MLRIVENLRDKLKDRAAERKERLTYSLPLTPLYLLVTFLSYWTGRWRGREPQWIWLGLYTVATVFAGIHDYKEDGELTGTSVFFIVLDVILIGSLCFLFLKS